jgi:DNA (cytosine-5)-methyltransferase 1
MKHYGDITKINGAEVPIVDVICGGSPCQDLSVAGRREGLAGERSGLFMEQIRIIREQRNECIRQLQMRGAAFDIRRVRPRFMVWENVPGAFSSNKGEDFRVVLEETARVVDKDAVIPKLEKGQKWRTAGCVLGDGWSIAWRLHDAQFWGVPQRRKRIALVADFAGESAPEILFERKSVSRDIEQSGETRETVTRSPEGDVNPSSYTLKIRGGREVDSHGKKAGKGALIQTELSGTLGVSQDQTLITVNSSGDEIAGTLDANYFKECGEREGTEREVICIGNGQMDNMSCKPIANSLDTMHDQQAIITYGIDRASFNQGQNAKYDFAIEEEKSPTIVAKGPGGVSSRTTDNRAVVRRLTPLECERLQGYPDGWTDIGDWVDTKGKKHKGDADSPRYKALGNSIALPFWEWMAQRMVQYLGDEPTMASLFDGIGGFPLVFNRAGCKPVWASEIEEFPIAVTKIRFPEE